MYVQDRAALVGMRTSQYATYMDVEREFAEAEEKLKSLEQHRSVPEVDAVIATILARPISVNDRVRGTVGNLSGECKKSDVRTVQACAEIAALRGERAVAEEDRESQHR